MPTLNLIRVISECERDLTDYTWAITKATYLANGAKYAATISSSKDFNQRITETGKTPAQALNKCIKVTKLRMKLDSHE